MKKIYLSLILLLSCTTIWASTLPTIKIVVPFPVGGPVDVVARAVQQSLITELNASVVIENRPGAGATVGTIHALNNTTEPVLLVHATPAVLSTFRNPQPYSEKQLIPLVYLGSTPFILVASKKSGITDLQSLRNFGSKNIMFGTAGTASSSHMAMENFKLSTNLNMTPVPYKGAPPIVTDLIGGHIDLSFLFAIPVTLSHIQNKDFVPLAVNAKSRLPALKNVPTFEESGIKLLPNLTWITMFKAGVWQENQLQQVQTAMVRVMSDPKLSEPYRRLGLVWDRNELVPAANWVEQQRQSFAPLVKNINLQE